MITKIYVLTNSDGRIRYVGKTIKTLAQRLCIHLWEAKWGSKTYKNNWVRSLFKRGFLPQITLIGEVEGNGCREETAWIKYFREEGIRLTNSTDGGDGRVGYTTSKKTRIKQSLCRMGWNPSKATRLKMRLSHLGKKLPVAQKKKIGLKSKGNQYCKGYKHTQKTRRKMAIASSQRRQSEKTKQKLSLIVEKQWASKAGRIRAKKQKRNKFGLFIKHQRRDKLWL